MPRPSTIDPRIVYRDEYLCGCKLTILVAATAAFGAFAGDEGYRHCSKDSRTHILPGPFYAVWERQDGNWVAAMP